MPKKNKNIPLKKRGRKTKYRPEFCDMLISFFDAEPYTDIQIDHYDAKTGEVKWTDIKRMPNKLPTLVEFARMIQVSYAAVYDWIDKKHSSFQPKFLQSYMRAKEAQKNFLVQAAIQGLYNPVFAKFTAINITDMRDQIDVKNTGPTQEEVDEKVQKAVAVMTTSELLATIQQRVILERQKNKKQYDTH